MWVYEVTSKQTPTWGYENAWMQARAHEPEDMRMWGYENTRKQVCTNIRINISNMYVISRLHVGYYNLLQTGLCTPYV